MIEPRLAFYICEVVYLSDVTAFIFHGPVNNKVYMCLYVYIYIHTYVHMYVCVCSEDVDEEL